MSLGAAIENLLLEAAANGLKTTYKFTPEYISEHVASLKFQKGYAATSEELALVQQIDNRHTNRQIGPEFEPVLKDLNSIRAVAESDSQIKMIWVTDPEAVRLLGEISGEADLLRMYIPEAHEDFVDKEMRWDLNQTNNTGDGIGIHTLDLSNSDQIGLRLMKDKKAVSFLKSINGGAAFKRLSLQQFQHSTAIGLLTSKEISASGYLSAGIQMEKMWLKANELGYKIHPMNVPLIFFYKNSIEKNTDLPEEFRLKISKMHKTFREIFKIDDDIAEIFLFRLFQAKPSPIKTIRRPLNKTLTFGTTETTY